MHNAHVKVTLNKMFESISDCVGKSWINNNTFVQIQDMNAMLLWREFIPNYESTAKKKGTSSKWLTCAGESVMNQPMITLQPNFVYKKLKTVNNFLQDLILWYDVCCVSQTFNHFRNHKNSVT